MSEDRIISPKEANKADRTASVINIINHATLSNQSSKQKKKFLSTAKKAITKTSLNNNPQIGRTYQDVLFAAEGASIKFYDEIGEFVGTTDNPELIGQSLEIINAVGKINKKAAYDSYERVLTKMAENGKAVSYMRAISLRKVTEGMTKLIKSSDDLFNKEKTQEIVDTISKVPAYGSDNKRVANIKLDFQIAMEKVEKNVANKKLKKLSF